MRQLSVDMAFPALECNITEWQDAIMETGSLPCDLMSEEESRDLLRWWILYLIKENLIDEARQELSKIDAHIFNNSLGGAWIHLADMTLLIEAEDYSEALVAGEQSLRTLALLDTDRTHPDYVAIVAGVIYNLALLHHKTGENVRAEKELIKAQKLLDKLAKKNKSRFGASLVVAIEASTTIFNSRIKQMNILAHYQVTTDLYLDKANKGISQAIYDLVKSLQQEGDIHLKIGNYRDAVKYYTKALRYQKKVTPKMGELELNISINMGEALLHIRGRQATGEQLLRSLLPLAERLDAFNEKNRILALLDHKGKSFDFMSFLKNLF